MTLRASKSKMSAAYLSLRRFLHSDPCASIAMDAFNWRGVSVFPIKENRIVCDSTSQLAPLGIKRGGSCKAGDAFCEDHSGRF